MKIAGHAMGTSEYMVDEAIELFHRIGADEVEIIVQDEYCSGVLRDRDEKNLSIAKRYAEENEIEVSCLTPYNSYSNSLDEEVRQAEIKSIRSVIDYCQCLNAHYIHIYGGNLLTGDIQKLEERREKLTESLRCLDNPVAQKDVVLIVENHFNTMAVSAKNSAALIRNIDHPAVRILYDQVNLTFMGNEGYEEAVSLQQQYVSYMHVKDLVFLGGKDLVLSGVSHSDESERNARTRTMGEGILDWPAILKSVKAHGYDGRLSLGYERRWHPDDIPDVFIGMKKSIDYLKSILFRFRGGKK